MGTKRIFSALSRDSGKIVAASEAVRLIRDGDTLATSGFVDRKSVV